MAEVMKESKPKRQGREAAYEKAKARSYPRPLCEPTAKPNYTYKRGEYVPPREALVSDRWDTKEKPRATTRRNPIQLAGDPIHKAIFDHGVRRSRRKELRLHGVVLTNTGSKLHWNYMKVERFLSQNFQACILGLHL